MDSQGSQHPLDVFSPPLDYTIPATPELAHNTLPDDAAAAVAEVQAERFESATAGMTPPPSTQLSSMARIKTRTPTPTISHISTPPPTIEFSNESLTNRVVGTYGGSLTAIELQDVSKDDLVARVVEMQASVHEAKMSAAHYKLQYQMLSQESTAALERMAVEARMMQYENEVIHIAEQAKSKPGMPVQPSPIQEGTIPVQKDHYQRLCRDSQLLKEANNALEAECNQQQKIMLRQENEIASLGDKVILMQERIRESREHLHRYRKAQDTSRLDVTPRPAYSTPRRGQTSAARPQQPQPFAALLQASEMVSQESARSHKKGHARNTLSMSSLPTTPQRMQQMHAYSTPRHRQPPLKIPSTAPVPRTSAMHRTPDIYTHSQLPVSYPPAPASEGTVSASDAEVDGDSEAETDILDPEDSIGESHASRAASQMLRSSQEIQAKRESFQGSGMVKPAQERMKQTKLFGAVRKAGVDRSGEEPAAKRARTGEKLVGLGISGARD